MGKVKVRCVVVVEVTLLGLILPWGPRRVGCGAALVWRTGCVRCIGGLWGMRLVRGRGELCDIDDFFASLVNAYLRKSGGMGGWT